MNPKVDFFFDKESKWQKEFEQLRMIILTPIAIGGGLTEELKWGQPCYMYQGTNIVLIHGFKDYCAYLFHKGALLKDPKSLLIQQTENVQSARQIRFTHVDQIADVENVLKSYIKEAMKLEKAGVKVPMKKTSEFKMPVEFKNVLDATPALKKAFAALTPGRRSAP